MIRNRFFWLVAMGLFTAWVCVVAIPLLASGIGMEKMAKIITQQTQFEVKDQSRSCAPISQSKAGAEDGGQTRGQQVAPLVCPLAGYGGGVCGPPTKASGELSPIGQCGLNCGRRSSAMLEGATITVQGDGLVEQLYAGDEATTVSRDRHRRGTAITVERQTRFAVRRAAATAMRFTHDFGESRKSRLLDWIRNRRLERQQMLQARSATSAGTACSRGF
jgi:hypothetical protein